MDYWRRFADVAGTHPSILQRIISHLPAGGGNALRQVNRAMRAAVNRTVTTAAVTLSGPRVDTELATAFPDANFLRISTQSDDLVSGADISMFLEYVLKTSPALVDKLQSMVLSIVSVEVDDEITSAIAGFLSRCTNLQQLEVNWKDDLDKELYSQACFKGVGCTAEERRASMQQQLAALCGSTAFLAPESWGAHHCLASLDLSYLATATTDVYLSAATQTTKVRRLAALMGNASSFTILGGLSNLRELTYLELYASPAAAGPNDELIAAIAQLSRLQDLHVDGALIGQGVAASPCGIPASWSGLTALTEVYLEHCGHFALSQLTALVAVEHLYVASVVGVGDISSLFALTRLTSLTGPTKFIAPDIAEGAAPGGAPGSSGQLVVPPQWRQRLQHLNWRQYSRSSLSMLAQLASLGVLELVDAVVSQQLCRALGKLPHLAELKLQGATAPGGPHFNLDAIRFRPMLPALTCLELHSLEPNAPLHVLARWTEIPATCAIEVTCDASCAVQLAVEGWGGGWLPAVLATCSRAQHTSVVMVDDSDVDLYLAAEASLATQSKHTCYPWFWLGKRVTPAGFSRLLCSPQQQPAGLELDADAAVGPCALQWEGHLGLTPEYLNALAGLSAPRLWTLALSQCQELTNRDLAMLVGACPFLKDVLLYDASKLTDLAMYALGGCRQLEVVQISGAAGVTEEGAGVLLTMSRALLSLTVAGVPVAEPDRWKLHVQRVMPAGAYLQWVVSVSQASIVWTKRGGRRR